MSNWSHTSLQTTWSPDAGASYRTHRTHRSLDASSTLGSSVPSNAWNTLDTRRTRGSAAARRPLFAWVTVRTRGTNHTWTTSRSRVSPLGCLGLCRSWGTHRSWRTNSPDVALEALRTRLTVRTRSACCTCYTRVPGLTRSSIDAWTSRLSIGSCGTYWSCWSSGSKGPIWTWKSCESGCSSYSCGSISSR